MGRTAGPKKLNLLVRIREELLVELYLKRPELQDASGHTKYGAITTYFERLIREDLDKTKGEIPIDVNEDPVT